MFKMVLEGYGFQVALPDLGMDKTNRCYRIQRLLDVFFHASVLMVLSFSKQIP